MWPNAVSSLTYSNGVLSLTLNSDMLAHAVYPLYVDPTWTLSSTLGWGASTFQDAVVDQGDHTIKIGWIADNFNDNVNEIWTIDAGSVTFSGGVMNVPAGSSVHAGSSWYNQRFAFTVNFVNLGSTGFAFRHVDVNNKYQLLVAGSTGFVSLEKWIGGVGTTLGSFTTTITTGTTYSAKIVAFGNYFEVWWQGTRKLAFTDPSPPSPISGNIQVWTAATNPQIKVDDVRVWNTTSGTFTSYIRDAGAANVANQTQDLGSSTAYNSTDLWINSSSDNTAWAGWHLIKSTAAPGSYSRAPDVDRRRYYQVRAVLRSGVDGTPAVQEIDTFESPPPSSITATANTGRQPWSVYVGGMVNAVSGNLFVSKADVSIRAKGYSLALVRAYNSKLSGTSGPFGVGTSHNFNAKLTFPGGGNVTLTDGDGASFAFTTLGGGAFAPPRGLHDNLVRNGDNTYTLWRPDGSRFNFAASGLPTSIVDKNGNHLTLTYTGSLLTRISDDSGLALTIAYDGSNRISTVTDPVNRRVSYTYNTTNVFTRFTDPLGFSENYTYDPSNRLILRVDRAGHVDRFTYDGTSRVSQVWIGFWNYTTSRIQWQTRAYAITYATGNKTTVVNAEGPTTTLFFNTFGNPTARSGPNVADAGCPCSSGGNSSGVTWDGEFDQLTATDGRGSKVAMSFDWAGNLVAFVDPGGNITSHQFQNVQNATAFLSLPSSDTTPRGFTTTYGYDAKGNLITVGHPDGNVSYLTYDTAGSLIQRKDFRGNIFKSGYDPHGFAINSTDAGGNVTLYQNDGVGRLWNTTSPGGNVTRSVYDLDDRIKTVTDAMGNSTTYSFNGRGDVTRITDANNSVTQYTINLTVGRVEKISDPGGNKTTFTYNVTGNLLTILDGNTHVTTYGYDIYHRQTTTTTPLLFVTKVTYDAAGNVIARLDANGNLTRYVYDRSNRPFRTTYPGGPTVVQSYDKDGNLVDRTGFEIEEKYSYDALDRLTASQQIFLTTTLTLFHNYTYDANGNRRTMDGDGGGTNVWDANNRLSRETSGNLQWTQAFGKDGQLLKRTNPDGQYTTYSYNKNGALLNMTSRLANGTFLEYFTYAYDKVGNRVSMKEFRVWQNDYYRQTGCSLETLSCTEITWNTFPSGLSPSPQTTTVSVRVRGATYCGGPGCQPPGSSGVSVYVVVGSTQTYLGSQSVSGSFDIVKSGSVQVSSNVPVYAKITYSVVCKNFNGLCLPQSGIGHDIFTFWYGTVENLQTYTFTKEYRLFKVAYADGTSTKYTYDAVGNTKTKISGTTITYTYDDNDRLTSSTDGYSYSYDHNGNMRTKTIGSSTTVYAYDYENRMTSATSGGTSLAYGYSSSGLRTSNRTGTRPTTYDGYDLAGTGGSPQVTGQYVGSRPWTRDVRDAWTGNSLEWVDTTKGNYYVHGDGLGSLSSMTDAANGAVNSTYRYDAYGMPIQAEGNGTNPYRYTGQAYDAPSGLYYYRARYYDPATGRFLSPDPAGMVDGPNRYAYVAGNPVSFVDPTGTRVGSCMPNCGVPPGVKPYHPGGGASGSAQSSLGADSSTPFWQLDYCAEQDLLVAAAIALAFLGIVLESSALLAWAAYAAVTSAVLDAHKIIENPSDLIGVTGALLDLIWSLLTGLIFPLFAYGWWQQMVLGAEVAIGFTPPSMAAKLIMVGAIAAIGIAGLEMQGCGIRL